MQAEAAVRMQAEEATQVIKLMVSKFSDIMVMLDGKLSLNLVQTRHNLY